MPACTGQPRSAHVAAWCVEHNCLLETCLFRRIAKLEAALEKIMLTGASSRTADYMALPDVAREALK